MAGLSVVHSVLQLAALSVVHLALLLVARKAGSWADMRVDHFAVLSAGSAVAQLAGLSVDLSAVGTVDS
tara:strand:+ start:206 stop:412 length:207 start_codon:yes stop_codon:yes gene_type:complete